MSDYQIQEIEINQLLLDLQNPRQNIQQHQREAMASIVNGQGAKLIKLAQDIVTSGMNPSDLLIVTPDQDSIDMYIVLEGNRRLSVLKMLHQPDLIKSLEIQRRSRNTLIELSSQFQKNRIDTLLCAVFKERELANKWIELKHTGENKGVGVVSWDPSAVARFNMSRGKADKNIIALQAIEFVMENGELDDKTQEKLGSIAITNFSRLLADPKVRGFLGVEVEDKQLMTRLPVEEAAKGLTRIVKDLAHKKIDVNTIRNKKNREDYLETFQPEEIPERSSMGETLQTLGLVTQQAKSEAKKTKRSNPKSTQRKALIPSSCILKIDSPRINNIYRELKSLEVSKFPNAAAVMFRVFLEVSLDNYIKSHSIDMNGTKLFHKVQTVANHLELTVGIMTKAELKAIRAHVSNKNSLFSINTLNAYVHNGASAPIPSELKLIWDNYQLYIEKIWQ